MIRTGLALVLLTLTACSTPPPQPVDGYWLQADDEQVSLRFTNLPLDEFLKVAQQVTGEIYVYEQALVGETEPLSLVGQLRCERAEFGNFVRTMLHLRGLELAAAGEGDMKCWQVRRASGS